MSSLLLVSIILLELSQCSDVDNVVKSVAYNSPFRLQLQLPNVYFDFLSKFRFDLYYKVELRLQRQVQPVFEIKVLRMTCVAMTYGSNAQRHPVHRDLEHN